MKKPKKFNPFGGKESAAEEKAEMKGGKNLPAWLTKNKGAKKKKKK